MGKRLKTKKNIVEKTGLGRLGTEGRKCYSNVRETRQVVSFDPKSLIF